MHARARAASVVLAVCLGCGGGAARAPVSDGAVASEGCRAGAFTAVRGARQEVVVGGERRSYLIDAPAGPADVPRPVVLVFHGFRSDAWNPRNGAGWPLLAERDGFIALHPDGHEGVRLLGTEGRGWDLAAGETRDAAFVAAVLDRIERERCVDRRRVFATGFSNGGFFASLLGCALADRIAAIAAVGGAHALPGCTPARPVPVLLLHGRADEVVEPALVRGARDWWSAAAGCTSTDAEGPCELQRGCRADVVFCLHPGGHVWPADATPRIWRFFQDHPQGAAQVPPG
jgi:polyhydroxybutyrate depolymerase